MPTAAPDGARRRRIGVFGGTFDPPHVGHVRVAGEVADALSLDQVWWVPAGTPPHKQDETVSPASIRREMTAAAAAKDPRFVVSDVEVDRAGPSYTVDTLRRLRTLMPEVDFFLILGADQLRTFATGWRSPDEVLRLSTLVLVDRQGDSAMEAAPDVPGIERAVRVAVTRVDVSSSQVRAWVAAGRDASALVPPGVCSIILREGLYTG